MTEFARTHDDPTWTTGNYVTVETDWEDLDSKVFRSVNGDRGGTWRPSSPIALTGNMKVTGPALIAWGGSLAITSGELRIETFSGTFVNWPVFESGHPLRSRSILQSFLPSLSSRQDEWLVDVASASIVSIALAVQGTSGLSISNPPPIRLALRVHDQATLARATFTFRVPPGRADAPTAMPRFRVVRVDSSGRVEPLASTAAGADAAGWMSPPQASSAAEWYADGAAQTFVYPCDTNNLIDRAHTYYAEVVEEGGPTSPVPQTDFDGSRVRERKLDVDLATTGPLSGPLSGSATVDGTGIVTGMRILVKDGVSNLSGDDRYEENGIYIANAVGAWTRATDLDTLDKFTPDFFVRVVGGVSNAGAGFQLAAPYPIALESDATPLGSPLYFERLRPRGNTYHSVLLDFENINDIRFQ